MDDRTCSGLHNPRPYMVLPVVPHPDSSPRISPGAQQNNINQARLNARKCAVGLNLRQSGILNLLA